MVKTQENESYASIPNYNFFCNKLSYFKTNPTQQVFLDNLSLYILKGHFIMLFVENPWLI
jgi:cytochrome c oxidase assembly protein Cox11